MRADIGDRHHYILRQLALDGQVPRLLVAAVNQAAPRAALGHVARQRARRRSTGPDPPDWERPARWSPRPEAVRRGIGRVDHQRIPAAQRTGERNRIEVDSVTGANHGLVAETVGQADARREQLVADRDSRVFRRVAAAAQKHLVVAGTYCSMPFPARVISG